MPKASTITGNELPNRYVTRQAAAVFLGLSPATLASWASAGCGPRFTKLSAGRSGGVRYSLAELQAFAEDPVAYGPRPVGRFNKPTKGQLPTPIPGPNPARSRRRRQGKKRSS